MKKIDEMKAKLDGLKKETQALLDEGKVAEARGKMAAVRELRDAIDAQEELAVMEDKEIRESIANQRPAGSTAEFAAAARRGFRAEAGTVPGGMKEGGKADGGYTVPEDIDTQIRTLREAADSLDALVDVQSVTAPSGAQTFKTRAQQTGFAKVDEGGAIGAKETPTFTRIAYAVEKYAGYFSATNELLEDTDANIVGTLVAWIGGESRVTHNKLILNAVKTIGAEENWTGVDDLKKALNVTLDRAFLPFTSIITNQDGLQYLDTLKDSDGRYLLTPDVQNPTQYRLFGYPVKVLGNATLASEAGNIPFIVGDLKSAVRLFVRKGLTVTSTNVGMDAFEKDLTIWRAIERLDCKVIDAQAVVRGKIAQG